MKQVAKNNTTTKTETQVADFKRDGYLCIESLFNARKMEEINVEVDEYIQHTVPTMPEARVYYEDKSDLSTLKQIQHMSDYSAYFARLMEDSPVRKIAEAVLQEEVVPVNMQYFNKPAGKSQATPPHQDGYYFYLNPCKAVTGWLALEDVDHVTGCIHYLQGSHHSEGDEEFRPHGQTTVLGFSKGITDFGTLQDKSQTVAFPGQAGTFLMHHAKTVHWASANNSTNRTRRALGFIYYAKSAKVDLAAKDAYQRSLDQKLLRTNKI